MPGHVSADTEDLAEFVDGGSGYLDQLDEIRGELKRRRERTVDAIGGGPPESSAGVFEELLVEVEISTRYVAGVRDSLLEFEASGLTGPVPEEWVIDGLRSRGYRMTAGDLSLAEDEARLAELRANELVSLGLGEEVARGLAGDEDAFDAARGALELGVHPEVVGAADPTDLVRVMDRQQRTEMPLGPIPPLDGEQVEALLAGRYRPELADGVLAGTVSPPTDPIRDRVVAAMEAGRTPADVGLDPAYFPEDYVEFHELNARIADAEARREVADGGWGWRDGDDEQIAAIDSELDELRADRDEARSDGGLSDDGRSDGLDAVAATSIATGGGRWEGEIYADIYSDLHDDKISGGGIFGHGEGAFKDPDGSEAELEHIGSRVAADPAAATAFFNGAGVERVAMLPTFVVGNDLGSPVLDDYGRALATASNVTNPDGSPALDFGGDDLVNQPLPDTQDGVIWYNPALLFGEGRFEEGFLADATEAVLVLGHEGDPRGVHSHRGRDSASGPGGGTVVTYHGGEDPRNVLLDRAAEDPAVVDLVIAQLDEGEHGLAPLLSPSEPMRPAYDPDVHRHWIDGLKDGLDGNATGHDHPTLDPAGYPRLGSDYPITSFLGVAAGNGESSRRVILFIADAADDGDVSGGGGHEDGRVLRDPGTAAGVDLIMAAHATVMFRPSELRAVGIERTDLNDGPGRNVGAEEWKAVHGEVLGWGRGQALALRADGLLDQAIVGSIDEDGVFHVERTRSFAQIAARTEAEAYEALFNYGAELDEEAKSKNREANIAASLFFDLVGTVPHPAAALAGATGGGLWAGFFDGYPTDRELSALKSAWDEQFADDLDQDWAWLIMDRTLDEATPGDGEGPHYGVAQLNVSGQGAEQVRVRRIVRNGVNEFSFLDPVTGEWVSFGPNGGPPIEDLADGMSGAPTAKADRIERYYVDERKASGDSLAGATAEWPADLSAEDDGFRTTDWLSDG